MSSIPKKTKSNLPTPPPRANISNIPTPIRTRSRSANNRPRPKSPNHPSPPAPQRSKSPKPKRFPVTPTKKVKKFPKPKPPIKNTKNKSQLHAKQLPNTPTRIRAKTTAPSSKTMPYNSHKGKRSPNRHTPTKQLPAVCYSKIDHRPLLKPSFTTCTKKNACNQEEKQNGGRTALTASSKPPPPPKTAHNRDYSIVKSIPSIFKMKSMAKSKKNTRQFGLKPPPPDKDKKKGGAATTGRREGVLKASCQCGAVKYELLSLPQELQHCYCSMCRKLHGSASATWTPFLERDVRFVKNGKQSKYKSSNKVTRSFCSNCGANLSLKYGFQTDTIWLTPSLFDGPAIKHLDDMDAKAWWLNVRVLHIFCASKCAWYDIPEDGHPQLSQSDIQNSEINGEPRYVYGKQLPPKPSQK